MSDAGKPPQRLGSLGSGQDRLRGRGRGRGTLRKFAPTVAPRRAGGNAEPGSAKPAIPKLLEAVQRPEVDVKPVIRPRKHQEPTAPSTVTFVASDVKKSSFVPNDRSLRTTSAVSYSSTPSGSPLRDNDMDVDEDNADGSGSFAPIVLPFAFDGRSKASFDIEADDVKTEEPSPEAKLPEDAKNVFQSVLRHGNENSEFIFWQLPSRFPTTAAEVKDTMASSKKAVDPKPAKPVDPNDLAAADARLPDGFLGKLVLYKSGKVVLRCGSVDFLVNSATQYPYRQELMAFSSETTTCNRLATVNHRVVCTPDLSTLDHDFSDLNLLI